MPSGTGWNLVEARLQISLDDHLLLAPSALGLAPPAPVSLSSACGLHAPSALRAEGRLGRYLVGQIQNINFSRLRVPSFTAP